MTIILILIGVLVLIGIIGMFGGFARSESSVSHNTGATSMTRKGTGSFRPSSR